MKPLYILAFSGMVLLSPLQAESWPQFRGPGGSATLSAGDAIPTEWSDSENLKWKTELPGPGSSSPVFWENKLFVTCYSGYATSEEDLAEPAKLVRELLCLDRHSGEILWKKSVPLANPEDPYRGYIRDHGYASGTPVTDGKKVYAFFGKSGLHAFSIDGEELWKKDVGKDSSNRRWGSGASPILHGDLVIVNAADESRALIAFDKNSGEERWRHESDKLELTYGTPQIRTASDGKPELVLAVPREMWGLDPESGKRRWFATTNIPGNICPSAVISKEVICAFGGYPRNMTVAVKPGGQGDSGSEILWTSKTTSYVPTPLVFDDQMFWVSDRAEAFCMKPSTGEVVTKRDVDGIVGARARSFYASMVRVGDRLVAVSRRNGTFVFEASSGMKQLAQNRFEDDSDFNATPALAEDALYLRSNRFVYCIAK